MLWWLVGGWLVSGAAVPLLWLLSLACQVVLSRSSESEETPVVSGRRPLVTRLSPVRNHRWPLLLSGAVGVAVLIALYIGSGKPTPPADVAEAAMSPPAVTPPRPEIDKTLTIERPPGDSESAPADGSLRQTDASVPQGTVSSVLPVTENVVMPPAYPGERADGARDRLHSLPRTPVAAPHSSRAIRTYVTQSRRGTWLFGTHQNSGANS
jgi:hypothetical protein